MCINAPSQRTVREVFGGSSKNQRFRILPGSEFRPAAIFAIASSTNHEAALMSSSSMLLLSISSINSSVKVMFFLVKS